MGRVLKRGRKEIIRERQNNGRKTQHTDDARDIELCVRIHTAGNPMRYLNVHFIQKQERE